MLDAQRDDDLVRLTLAGRMAAFTQLARRHQDYAYARAFGVLADSHLAHDVVQEALLAAYRDLPKLRDPSRFRPWLSGIVRHMAHRAFRELGRVSALAEAVGEESHLVEGPPRPARLIEREERRQQVQAALRRLSGTSRQVVTLYYMDGLSYADVSEMLGVSRTVVQGRLQRAREQLRRDLLTSEEGLRSGRLPPDFSAQVARLLEEAASRRADRESVSSRLLAMGAHAVPSLCEALDGDARDSVRTLAGRVLSEIGDPRALHPLLSLLYAHRGRGMQHWLDRGFQAARLLRITGMRESLLHTVRTEPDKNAQWLAFGILAEAREDAKAFEGVYGVFRDPSGNPWTRTQALTTLCKMRPGEAPRAVGEAVTQQDARVRGAGVRLAVRYGLDPPPLAVCIDLFARTSDWGGKLCVARLLLGRAAEGRTALARFMREGSPGERAVATLALAQERSEEAVRVLMDELFLARRDRRKMKTAIHDGVPMAAFLPPALKRLARENPTQVGPLIEGFLAAGDPGIRVASLKILAAQKGCAFLGELRSHVRGGGKVGRAALAEMERLKDVAMPIAVEMAASDDHRERRAGDALLRRLGYPPNHTGSDGFDASRARSETPREKAEGSKPVAETD